MEYKFFQLCPCRNNIKLNTNNIIESKKITNFYINNLLEDDNILCQINKYEYINIIYTYYNIYIIINSLQKYIKKFTNYIIISNHLIQHTIIKDKIYIDNKIYIITRHLKSFIQPDDTIRFCIHNILYNYFKFINKNFNYGIYLGGECYIYGKIFNYLTNNKIYITDTISIYYDCILNDNKKSLYNLINYNDSNSLNFLSNLQLINSFIIINISKIGLTTSLVSQLLLYKINMIILINCNRKSFNKDINLLNIYKLNKQFIYKTNYEVIVSILYIKN